MLPPVQAGRPPAPHHAQQGVALVIALLFTTIVLMIVVSTTATMTLGARKGGVNERAAYQALLAAESGLNTLSVRFRAQRDALPAHLQFRGSSPAALNSWLSGQGLSTYADAPVTATTAPATGIFTLMATGSAGDARAQVLQDFHAVNQPAFNIRAEAALQSYSNVDITGGAAVQGESMLDSTGTIQVALVAQPLTVPAGNTPFEVVLQPVLSSRLLLGPDDYVGLQGRSYRVLHVDRQAGAVTLVAVAAAQAESTVPTRSEVHRADSAVTTTFTGIPGTTGAVAVSDPSQLTEGSTVLVGPLRGTVQSIDAAQRTATVAWEAGGTMATVAEGTPVRRNVRGVISGYGITGQDQVVNGSLPDDSQTRGRNPFSVSPGPDLFASVLGQTKYQMLAVSPYQGWLEPTVSAAEFTGMVAGLTFIDGAVSLNGNRELCGSGLLIVRGNLTVNGTCAAGFSGAVYVMGDFDQQGNSVIRGAVITEGADQALAGTECMPSPSRTGSGPGNACDTKVAGTGQGSAKIVYDRGALLAAGSLLSALELQAIPGTWRQQ
ncbi:pilus assembly PilX N-terminal domain-containing protein [Deinococcus deserti]|uniref:Type 4 fimbrial biogenesis protein PilX N-terminal domain-containing protein n=1 Tax=Deinococcus deserti (strain DSM 17065 / CIP 109153 / LMG 22923 / VCD115) TaxID=546414 RepID=C1CZZ9_DEIDV|nr:pilus assembly PilX N-terminal domain-containing protein [Deinococcus deserti]ACO45251.1 Hypothetical protein Deide_04240 [Deinococcus deserti VCD115]